jgi:hypothetical protein
MMVSALVTFPISTTSPLLVTHTPEEPWRSIQEPLDGWDEARRILEQEGVTGIGVQD